MNVAYEQKTQIKTVIQQKKTMREKEETKYSYHSKALKK